jgi:hypothetical protein
VSCWSQTCGLTFISFSQLLMRGSKSTLPTTPSFFSIKRSSSWKESDQGRKPYIAKISGQNSTIREPSRKLKGVRVEPLSIWHHRLGHPNSKSLLKMDSMGSLKGLALFKDQLKQSGHCRGCLQGKMCSPVRVNTHQNYKYRTSIHSDVCGPMQLATPIGERYFMAFKDDFFGWIETNLLKCKSEVPNTFKKFSEKLTETGGKAIVFSSTAQLFFFSFSPLNQQVYLILRSYGGGEYKICWQEPVSIKITLPYTIKPDSIKRQQSDSIIKLWFKKRPDISSLAVLCLCMFLARKEGS